MTPPGTFAITLALLLDLAFSEPPKSIHPVVMFGRLVSTFDRPYRRPLVAGILIAIVLPLFAGVAVAIPVALFTRWQPLVGGVVAGILLFTTVSFRMLLETGARVVRDSEADIESARETVVSLVGRDPASLSAGEIRSATVESVAENLADGLLAPLLAFALGSVLSVPAGVGAAAWVKGVNTLDSMLGYPEKPVGTASARLDDVVEWIPARLGALLIAVASVDLGAAFRAREWARTTPSPNSGWPMATLATTSGIRLRKPGVYDLNPDAPLPTAVSASRGIRTVGWAGLLAFGLTGVIACL
ncbi:MAG: adenosylcobinamide-phosphate synthase CbiB [Halodesulfurarchaeum sp.]